MKKDTGRHLFVLIRDNNKWQNVNFWVEKKPVVIRNEVKTKVTYLWPPHHSKILGHVLRPRYVAQSEEGGGRRGRWCSLQQDQQSFSAWTKLSNLTEAGWKFTYCTVDVLQIKTKKTVLYIRSSDLDTYIQNYADSKSEN